MKKIFQSWVAHSIGEIGVDNQALYATDLRSQIIRRIARFSSLVNKELALSAQDESRSYAEILRIFDHVRVIRKQYLNI